MPSNSSPQTLEWWQSFPESNPNPIVELDLTTQQVSYQNPASIRLFPDLQQLGIHHAFLQGILEIDLGALSQESSPTTDREVKVHGRNYLQTVCYLSALNCLRVYSFDLSDRGEMGRVRAQFEAIIHSSEDAIIAKTLQGIITSWNPAAERLFGYSEAEAIGQSMLMLIPPDRKLEEPEILAKISEGKVIDHFETVRVRKDGKLIDISASISPVKDKDGKIIGVSKITRDITERRLNQRNLQSQLERLNLLSQITQAIGKRQDLGSIFQVVVRTLEEQQPIDFCCICRYEPVAHSLLITNVGVASQAIAAELSMTEQSHVAIDKNGLSTCVRGSLVYESDLLGVQFPFPQRLLKAGLRSLVASPLMVEEHVFGVLICARREPQGFTSGECEFLKQLSDQVAIAANHAQLYSRLQLAYDDLRRTQQAVVQHERLHSLGQMASGIAHDINNAISPVALYAESLLETEVGLSVRARNYIQTIRRSIRDVAETVARMREFYRRREPQITLSPVSINELIRQVINLTDARWNSIPQEKGIVISLKTNLTERLPLVLGIESEIRDALINLVFNAVDAMPQGGTLIFTSRLEAVSESTAKYSGAPRVVVEISDSGVGMDENTRVHCLEPFYSTKGERGTGLGLAMVYGMVQRHNAEIEIQSTLGLGTAILLRFPHSDLVDVQSERATVNAVRMPAPSRILLIDDDPLLLKSLSDILESDGHQVEIANNGPQGIEHFRACLKAGRIINLVITDLGMPSIDGRKVAEEIKQISANTPVVMLTGWGSRMIEDGEIPPHVERVISKPPKLQELREAINYCNLITVSNG